MTDQSTTSANETTNPAATALVARSNRLGADPKNTNYAGGNTSAKGTETDPVTGEPVELLWVKGSGGDLGTLTESGLAVLRLDRMRALVDVYPGVDRDALQAAQGAGEVLTANGVLMDAFSTDVRPLLRELREERGLPANPMKAYAESGYQQQIEADRVGGTQAGWN